MPNKLALLVCPTGESNPGVPFVMPALYLVLSCELVVNWTGPAQSVFVTETPGSKGSGVVPQIPKSSWAMTSFFEQFSVAVPPVLPQTLDHTVPSEISFLGGAEKSKYCSLDLLWFLITIVQVGIAKTKTLDDH